MGLVGFAPLTTADTLTGADVVTCATVTTQACDTLITNPGVKNNQIDFFGSIAVGNTNSTGGSGDAQIDWFQNHFGLFANGTTNTTASDNALHMGGAQASGGSLDTLTVPVQTALGLNLGNTGTILLPYHLHGTIHISAPAFETAFVHFSWQSGFGPAGQGVNFGPAAVFNADRSLMSTDELTEVIDQNVILPIDYQVGQPEDFVQSVVLTAIAGGIAKPGNPGALVAVAEGDFLQTATLGAAIVLDRSGNPIPGAVVLSDSGFDYVHPGAVQPGSAVPEPGSLLLALISFSGLLFGLRRRA